jgi:hypothetical protein
MIVRNDGRAVTGPARTDVVFDPAAGEFARLTIDVAGRVVARVDLDPSEKRATLRRLFAIRTLREQRTAFVRALQNLDLLVVLAPTSRTGLASTDEMTKVFTAARDRREIKAFAERVPCSIDAFLLFAWLVNFAAAAEGQQLPRLEALDADLPYVTPIGAACPPGDFDAEATLRDVEREPEASPIFAFR